MKTSQNIKSHGKSANLIGLVPERKPQVSLLEDYPSCCLCVYDALRCSNRLNLPALSNASYSAAENPSKPAPPRNTLPTAPSPGSASRCGAATSIPGWTGRWQDSPELRHPPPRAHRWRRSASPRLGRCGRFPRGHLPSSAGGGEERGEAWGHPGQEGMRRGQGCTQARGLTAKLRLCPGSNPAGRTKDEGAKALASSPQNEGSPENPQPQLPETHPALLRGAGA